MKFLTEVDFARVIPPGNGEPERRAIRIGEHETAIPAPPEGAPDPVVGGLAVLASAASFYGAQALEISTDKKLSEEWKAEKLAALNTKAVREIASAFALAVERADGRALEIEIQRDAVPPLAGNDIFGLRIDQEIRSELRRMELREASVLMDDPRTQLAVLRSPVPMKKPLAEVAKAKRTVAWEAANPDRVRALEAERAAAEWGRRTAITLAARVRSISRLSRARLVELLHGVDGMEVFGIARAETEAARRRAEMRAV